MKYITPRFLAIAFTCAVFALPACKAKKKVTQTPPPAAQPAAPPATPAQPQPTAPPAQDPAPVPPPPNYNFSNIQFEFNSGVLKTEAYPILDKAVAELKKDETANFTLEGNSSAEGTEKHNMDLSVERANAVKTYLVNSGISGSRLSVKGYGESNPIADNKTEDGRVLNRRVEIKKAN